MFCWCIVWVFRLVSYDDIVNHMPGSLFCGSPGFALEFEVPEFLFFNIFALSLCKVILGGGNSNIVYVHPYLGEMIQFDEHFFQMDGNHQLGYHMIIYDHICVCMYILYAIGSTGLVYLPTFNHKNPPNIPVPWILCNMFFVSWIRLFFFICWIPTCQTGKPWHRSFQGK